MSRFLESSKETRMHLWISAFFIGIGLIEYVLWQVYQPNDLAKLSWLATASISFLAYMAICPAISSLLIVPLGFFLRRHPKWQLSAAKRSD